MLKFKFWKSKVFTSVHSGNYPGFHKKIRKKIKKKLKKKLKNWRKNWKIERKFETLKKNWKKIWKIERKIEKSRKIGKIKEKMCKSPSGKRADAAWKNGRIPLSLICSSTCYVFILTQVFWSAANRRVSWLEFYNKLSRARCMKRRKQMMGNRLRRVVHNIQQESCCCRVDVQYLSRSSR